MMLFRLRRCCIIRGLADYLNDSRRQSADGLHTFAEVAELNGQKFEWAITWLGGGEDGFFNSYCNTVPTFGGTHGPDFAR